jgi:UDP-N-acetyl-D-glucosamine dehydrogenase
MRTLNYKTRFIELAGELNAEMPEFWVGKVVDALNEQAKAVRGSRVLLLGVAYKKNIGDIRESPALDVIRLLHQRGAEVSYHDPHVPTIQEEGITLSSQPLTAEALRSVDCLMIITDHSAVDYQLVKRHARATVDTRHVLPREPQGGTRA